MKPTSQIHRPARRSDSQRSFGHSINQTRATDWSFQPSSPDVNGRVASFHPHPAEGFRALSHDFFAVESKISYRLEAGVFVLIAALALWPLVLAAQAAFALLK